MQTFRRIEQAGNKFPPTLKRDHICETPCIITCRYLQLLVVISNPAVYQQVVYNAKGGRKIEIL